MRVTTLSTLVLPLLLISGPSDAQTSRQPRDARAQQLSVAAIEARERCSQQARLEVPVLTDDERRSQNNRRIAIYADCVRNLGFRP